MPSSQQHPSRFSTPSGMITTVAPSCSTWSTSGLRRWLVLARCRCRHGRPVPGTAGQPATAHRHGGDDQQRDDQGGERARGPSGRRCRALRRRAPGQRSRHGRESGGVQVPVDVVKDGAPSAMARSAPRARRSVPARPGRCFKEEETHGGQPAGSGLTWCGFAVVPRAPLAWTLRTALAWHSRRLSRWPPDGLSWRAPDGSPGVPDERSGALIERSVGVLARALIGVLSERTMSGHVARV